MTSPFFKDINPSINTQPIQGSSSFFSDLTPKSQDSFDTLSMNEKLEKLQEMSQQREADVGRAFIEGAIPGSSQITKYAEEKGYIQPTTLGDMSKGLIQGTGALLPITGVGKLASKALPGLSGSALGRTTIAGLTGAGYKVGKDTLEGEDLNAKDVAIEAGLFAGGQAAFEAARGVANVIKSGLQKYNLSKTGISETNKTAEKFGLRKFAGAEILEPRGFKPIVSPDKAQRVSREVNQGIDNITKEIINHKIPVAKAIRNGVDVKSIENNLYQKAYEAAKDSNVLVKTEPVMQWINKEIASTRAIAPKLDPGSEAKVKLLEDFRNAYTREGAGSTDLITGKKLFKNITPTQAANQMRLNNRFVKQIWKKPEFSGIERETIDSIAAFNNSLMESIETSGAKQVSDTLKMANNLHGQRQDLKLVNKIFQKAEGTKDGFSKIMRNSKDRSLLERALGEDAMPMLDEMAKYQEEVVQRMKHFVKKKDVDLNFSRKLMNIVADAPGRLAGLAYTSKNPANSYIKFQKAILKNELKDAENLAKNIVEDIFGKEGKNLELGMDISTEKLLPSNP